MGIDVVIYSPLGIEFKSQNILKQNRGFLKKNLFSGEVSHLFYSKNGCDVIQLSETYFECLYSLLYFLSELQPFIWRSLMRFKYPHQRGQTIWKLFEPAIVHRKITQWRVEKNLLQAFQK